MLTNVTVVKTRLWFSNLGRGGGSEPQFSRNLMTDWLEDNI